MSFFIRADMIQYIRERWGTLFLIFLVTGTIAYLIAKFAITPRYGSQAVIFPPNTHANIHLLEEGLRFGYDKEIGEHIEIMNSSKVRNAIIKTFNLSEHYRIDTTDRYYNAKLQKKYDKNISIMRTLNKSIHISVEDEDPKVAAGIANKIVEFSDNHKSTMVKENVRLAMESACKAYVEKEEVIVVMTDSLETLRQAGESVWTYGEERKSGRYFNYELQYRKQLDRYLNLKNRFEELETLYKDAVPRSYVVSEASVSDKPVYPQKGLSAILSGLIAVSIFVAFEKFKEVL